MDGHVRIRRAINATIRGWKRATSATGNGSRQVIADGPDYSSDQFTCHRVDC